MRIAVIGAGLAGLAAADALRREGVDVVVLEARDAGRRARLVDAVRGRRGRAWRRVRLPRRRGAARDRAAARPAAVPQGNVLRRPRAPRRRGRRRGPSSRRAVARLGRGAARRNGARRARVARPAAAGAAEAIAARVEVSSAYPASDLDASVLAETGAGFGRFDTFGVEGGNGRLAEALAAPLGPALLLETPVEAIEWTRRSVSIDGVGRRALGGPRRDRRARAGGPRRSASIRRFPSPRRGALAGVRYGQAAKLHVPLRPRPSQAPCSPSPPATGAYTQLGPDGEPGAVRGLLRRDAGRPRAAARVGRRREPGLAAVAALPAELSSTPTRAAALDLARRPLGPGRLLGPLALLAARRRPSWRGRRAARLRRRAHRRRLARADGGRAEERCSAPPPTSSASAAKKSRHRTICITLFPDDAAEIRRAEFLAHRPDGCAILRSVDPTRRPLWSMTIATTMLQPDADRARRVGPAPRPPQRSLHRVEVAPSRRGPCALGD